MKKIFLLVFIIFISCDSKELTTYEEMKSDKLMSEFFTSSELKDLSKIVDFFESEICLDKEEEECYYSFNRKTIEELIKETKDLKIALNYNHQKELYKKIDSSFLKEIWMHPSYFTGKDFKNKIEEKSFELNQFGKYALFIKSIGNKDVLFKDFYNTLTLSNETSFSAQASSFYRFKIKEFKGIKRKLFFAVYYLTVNDKIHNSRTRKKEIK